jgi:hypothetical protein
MLGTCVGGRGGAREEVVHPQTSGDAHAPAVFERAIRPERLAVSRRTQSPTTAMPISSAWVHRPWFAQRRDDAARLAIPRLFVGRVATSRKCAYFRADRPALLLFDGPSSRPIFSSI